MSRSDMTALPLSDLNVETGERPMAEKLPDVTPSQRRKGKHLSLIHEGHRRDMIRIAMVVDRIEAGDSPPEHLAQIVLAAKMSQNYAAFGNLCGQECQMLTFHHNAEEHHMFPELEAKAPKGIAAVVARLREEHEVVHELLDRLAATSEILRDDPSPESFAHTRDVFHQLHKVVQSHFGYEEEQLEEAIGVFLEGI